MHHWPRLFCRLRALTAGGCSCAADIQAGTLIASGVCHSSRVNNVRWSPDEKQLVSVGEDCSVCVWNFFAPE